ncbi:TIGR03089 family protein [Nocardiopsis xinjiangensis]|uniref:TIGR03089 family protein n=1 Tax=Nocardiopsis xinjiangensis TaxID=124285 RepID=UPI0003486182|nr:TIGR03089 family protein [Nocardiopsis xinjiangensis]
MSDTPAAPGPAWRALVAADPARPFVTAYDTSGGRVELSRATVDNWVSKTSNMLVDGLGTQPDDRIAVALPLHWQSLVWLLASWSVGATAVLGGPGEVPPGTQVAVTDAERLEAALDGGAEEIVSTSLHPLGLPMSEVSSMALDYTVEVRGHGDHFSPYPVDPSEPALETDRARTGTELVDAARKRAEGWGLSSGDRIAVLAAPDAPLTVLGEDVGALLAAVVTGAPLVLTPADADGLGDRLAMEHVTAVLDTTGAAAVEGEGFRAVV